MIYEAIILGFFCAIGAAAWFAWCAPVLTQAERQTRIVQVGLFVLIALGGLALGNLRLAVVGAVAAVIVNGFEMLRLGRKLRSSRKGSAPLTPAEIVQDRSENAALRAAGIVGVVAIDSTSAAAGGGAGGLHHLRNALGLYLFTPAEKTTPGGRAKGQTRFGYACIRIGAALGQGVRRLRGNRSWVGNDKTPGL